ASPARVQNHSLNTRPDTPAEVVASSSPPAPATRPSGEAISRGRSRICALFFDSNTPPGPPSLIPWTPKPELLTPSTPVLLSLPPCAPMPARLLPRTAVLLSLIPWTPKPDPLLPRTPVPDPLLPRTPVPDPAPSKSRLTLAGGTVRFIRSLV